MAKHYYITVADEGVDDQEKVAATLKAAGFEVEAVESASPEQYGVVHTEDALEEIWRLESGAEDCESPLVEGKPEHKEWGELTDEQREHFVSKMTDWMANQRYEQFYLSEQADRGVFDGVAISCRQHEPPRSWERQEGDAE